MLIAAYQSTFNIIFISANHSGAIFSVTSQNVDGSRNDLESFAQPRGKNICYVRDSNSGTFCPYLGWPYSPCNDIVFPLPQISN